MGITKSPLGGVNIDIAHFKEIVDFQKCKGKVVITSKYKNNLLTKEQVLQQIYQTFCIEAAVITFIFTGHGYF